MKQRLLIDVLQSYTDTAMKVQTNAVSFHMPQNKPFLRPLQTTNNGKDFHGCICIIKESQHSPSEAAF